MNYLHQNQMADSLKKFLDSELFCDTVIRTKDGKNVKLHKLILGSASQCLKSLLVSHDFSDNFDFETTILLPDYEFEDVT